MKIYLIIVLLFVTNISFAQEQINKEKLETAKKTIQLIEKKDYEGVKNIFPNSISKNLPEDALKYYVDLGSKFISEFGIPKDESLTTKVNMISTESGTILSNSIIFPFPATKDKSTIPQRVIEIGFIEKYGDKKIVSLSVYQLQQPQISTNIKYLDKLEFGTDSISNWRIYYSKGNLKNKNHDVFAVSGDLEKMKSFEIETKITELFKELSKAPIKDKSYPNDIIRFKEKPEYISFTWQYKNNSIFYKIQMIINKEKDVDEPLNDFVIVSTSKFANQPTIYYVEKNKINKIVKSLTELSNKDWKEYYEKRP
ncbi:hypothetical protein Fleli_0285 [Bernardetia litoralis DSM 6794]|uniref:Uncharacterized protein n=1 Tax=Bernardetia litoralis (strain ATCC 23117 / DSM 6794 / NBRC 15988 / NCIMB 1366 / Fx l1 / Sio-4) TaxID=880071 RepID=I4AFN9_BERLS|nr:hypothetical protein [Bernardetia litoralis]AFM02774.1 hypothetical protein Fleli_0285 [Bernardetia litoralis DSM 6794]